jgi:ATP-dependent HslUV protease ATP-binding subunit HslU
LENLTKADFLRILTEPENALTKQYKALIAAEEVDLDFQDEALEEIASMAFRINEDVENIGARRLHTVMSKLLNEILYDIPDVIGPNAHVVVTRQMVQEKLSGLVEDKDLSRYIL